MTRADLINALGIGRVSPRAFRASKLLSKGGEIVYGGVDNGDEDDDDDDDDPSEEEEAEENDDDQEQDEEEQDDEAKEEDFEQETKESSSDIGILPCKAIDIGGFYSSLCALGQGISIGTKVRVLMETKCGAHKFLHHMSV